MDLAKVLNGGGAVFYETFRREEIRDISEKFFGDFGSCLLE